MSAFRSQFVRLTAATVLLSACTTAQPHLSDPSASPPIEWMTTTAQASHEAVAGRYVMADKLLSDYAARFPATSEATDAMYWRALYWLDPANPASSPREAVQLFDSYLVMSNGTHQTEAQALRRLGLAIEARAVAAANTSIAPKIEPPKPEDKLKDDELQRVKDELAKANAELERIKRRLAQPKP
ncbi:MAG: hypothetical protein ABI664_09315 [bacterium]